MAFKLSLFFFIYVVGMSWTLIAMIWFESRATAKEMIQNLFAWPILWLFGFTLLSTFGVARVIDEAGYTIDGVIAKCRRWRRS
jgi:hypothetical protein